MSAVVRILFVVAALVLTIASQAQDRCATAEIEKKLLLKYPTLRTQFESWMQKRLTERSQANGRTEATTYRIPVVVHVLHNGEAVGTGANIPDAQVQSQIKVLNADYNRLNSDASKTPAEFLPVASGIDIEFVLAKQDPDGLPTNGITRTKAAANSYAGDGTDDTDIKSQAYWPAEDYLNIWVVNLSGGFLGYAHFPVTSLQVPDGPKDRLTDGVVIHYKAFGSLNDGAFNIFTEYGLGRTATHEIGHYLGLLHIFGDEGSCSTTDYVNDTPIQSTRTSNCPTGSVVQCGHDIMYQNYLDYTDDACMNMFTAGQVARFQVVLDNSIRRTTLSTSHGLQDPTQLALDLEAKSITAPLNITCGDDIVPQLLVRNRGTTAITSIKASFTVNGTIIETKDFTVSLASLSEQTLAFSSIDLPEPGTANVAFNILQVNGGTDDNTSNDVLTMTSQVSAPIASPFLQPFNSLPSNWQIGNPDGSITWANTTAPDSVATNKAMYMDFYDYLTASAKDQLISPFVNIPDGVAILKFDRSYAVYPGSAETLRVLVSVGCSSDLSQADEVFNKSGSDLATTSSQTSKFTPSGEAQWGSTGIQLNNYAGKTVRFIFEATNNSGNNLYLDNVAVATGVITDIKLVSLTEPGPVFCDPKAKPVITIQNLGTEKITKLTIITEVDGLISAEQTVTGLSLMSGDSEDLTLAALNLSKASNSITITISDPNGIDDDIPSNNVIEATRIYNDSRDDIPLRQNFDNGDNTWTTFTNGTQQWQSVTTATYNNGMVYKAFPNTNIGEESWLVSPALDMSRASEGSLFFNTSYGLRTGFSDDLRVMVSDDCGLTYNQLLFEKSGQDLSNQEVSAEWVPATSGDWTRNYVSINDFAGKTDVRFAFVAKNGNGNDLYLDNIEFFIQDNPDPPTTTQLFSVYNNPNNPYEFMITFNLPDKEDARVTVYNTVGQLMLDSEVSEALNQTVSVNLYGSSAGIYVARVQTQSRTSSSKVFLGK